MADENKGAGAGQEKDPKTATPGENRDPGSKRTEPGATTAEEVAVLLKENMSFKAELKKLKASQEKAEKDQLEKQGEYKQLHEKSEAKLKAFNDRLKVSEIKALALKEGMADLDYIKLIDTSSISIDDDGNVTGATEAISALKAAKPILFQTPSGRVPETPKPGHPGTGGGFATFEDWQKSPDRYEWAEKNPTQYKALVEKAKAPKGR